MKDDFGDENKLKVFYKKISLYRFQAILLGILTSHWPQLGTLWDRILIYSCLSSVTLLHFRGRFQNYKTNWSDEHKINIVFFSGIPYANLEFWFPVKNILSPLKKTVKELIELIFGG